MIKIVQKENKVLRQKSKPVPIEEIQSDRIQKIITEMKEVLDSQADGVAIAAPQIGYSVRIFVVSGKVPKILEFMKEKDLGREINIKEVKKDLPDEVYINPKLVKTSKEKNETEEGCLSVRWLYGKVKRFRQVSIEALDEQSRKIRKGASGFLAQIFQHEIDHLDGILFIDKASSLEEIKPHNE